MRVKLAAGVMVIALVALLLGPPAGQSQPPQGGGRGRGGWGQPQDGARGNGGQQAPDGQGRGLGGGGFGRGQGSGQGGFDPASIFDRMAQGGTTIKIADVRFGKDRMQEWATKNGVTNGTLTKEQFLTYSQEATRQFNQGGGQGQGGQGRGGWGGFGQGAAPGAGQGGFGGWGQRDADPAKAADQFFKQADRNGDGVLQIEEMSESLQSEKDRWDANKDGVIDQNEYREFFKALSEKRRADRAEAADPKKADDKKADDKTADDKKPAASTGNRMPGWFSSHDLDGDSQVALYEWKDKGSDLAEFRKWDLNGDGLITAEEVGSVLAIAAREKGETESTDDTRVASTDRRPGNPAAAENGGNPFSRLFGGFGRGQGGEGQGGGGFGRGQGGGGFGGFGRGQGGQGQGGGFGGFGRTQGGMGQDGGGFGGFGRGQGGMGQGGGGFGGFGRGQGAEGQGGGFGGFGRGQGGMGQGGGEAAAGDQGRSRRNRP